MDLQSAERKDEVRRKRLRVAAGLLGSLLLALTLFSNTLMSIKLPKVRTERPQQGMLEQTIRGSGVLKPRGMAEITNPAGWQTKQLLVKKGEAVQKGQLLVTFDTRAAESALEDEQARLAKLQLAVEQAQDQYIFAERQGDLQALRQAKREIENIRLDTGIQERRIESMQTELERGKEVRSPFDGTVILVQDLEASIPVRGESLMQIADLEKGLELTLHLPSDQASLLEKGEVLPVLVKGGRESVEGEILEAGESAPLSPGSEAAGSRENGEWSGSVRRVVLVVQAEGLEAGEAAELLAVKPSGQEALLVSNGAVHEDRTGAFVYVLSQVKGPLGNSYTVRRVAVMAGSSNRRETAILHGISAVSQIIVESSEPLQDGDQVRVQ